MPPIPDDTTPAVTKAAAIAPSSRRPATAKAPTASLNQRDDTACASHDAGAGPRTGDNAQASSAAVNNTDSQPPTTQQDADVDDIVYEWSSLEPLPSVERGSGNARRVRSRASPTRPKPMGSPTSRGEGSKLHDTRGPAILPAWPSSSADNTKPNPHAGAGSMLAGRQLFHFDTPARSFGVGTANDCQVGLRCHLCDVDCGRFVTLTNGFLPHRCHR